jgi:hypothetical protein
VKWQGRGGRRRPRRAATVAALAALTAPAVLAVGGCNVQKVDRKPKSELATEIERTNRASFDLTEPLTRDAVGLPDGRSGMVIGHTGGKPPIETTLRLPDGGRLSVVATGIAVQIPAEAPETRLPANLILNEEAESLEAAHQRLLDVADDLGLDRAEIEDWYTRAAEIRGSQELDAVAASFIRGAPRGYLRVGVEARYNPPSSPVLLNWQLDWGGDGASPAPAPAPAQASS